MHGQERAPDDPNTYLIDEVEVTMTIIDDKLTAESTSGSTGGKFKVADRDSEVRLVLEGTGSDEATVTLSRPQIDRLRTILSEIAGSEAADADDFDFGGDAPRPSGDPT